MQEFHFGKRWNSLERSIKNYWRKELFLLKALANQHFQSAKRKRPVSPDSPNFSSAALLLDCTTCPINRPTGTFQDGKKYWDGKNNFYGLKKQVAVRSTPPYTAVFVSGYRLGSVHDSLILDETSRDLGQYLEKKTGEIPTHPKWEIIADKADNNRVNT